MTIVKGMELTSVGRMKAGQSFLWMMVFEGVNAADWYLGREVSGAVRKVFSFIQRGTIMGSLVWTQGS